jgi:hypothetical protein
MYPDIVQELPVLVNFTRADCDAPDWPGRSNCSMSAVIWLIWQRAGVVSPVLVVGAPLVAGAEAVGVPDGAALAGAEGPGEPAGAADPSWCWGLLAQPVDTARARAATASAVTRIVESFQVITSCVSVLNAWCDAPGTNPVHETICPVAD